MNVIPKVSQISGRVWRFLGCNPGHMTLQGTNIYLVGTGPSRILVDAGQDGYPEYVNALSSFLSENKISLDRILITHWHQDHIGALGDLKSTLFTKFQSSPPVHKFVRKELPERDIPEGYTLKTMEDNEQFTVEGATLRVMFTPGHTSDHAAMFLQEDKAVFSGDCILGEGTTIFEDLYDYMQSLEKILDSDPQVIYPGHGPIVEQPKEKIQFYINHRNQREKQILDVIKSSENKMNPSEIVRAVYKDTPENLLEAAELNVLQHLSKLVKEKKIHIFKDTYFSKDNGKL